MDANGRGALAPSTSSRCRDTAGGAGAAVSRVVSKTAMPSVVGYQCRPAVSRHAAGWKPPWFRSAACRRRHRRGARRHARCALSRPPPAARTGRRRRRVCRSSTVARHRRRATRTPARRAGRGACRSGRRAPDASAPVPARFRSTTRHPRFAGTKAPPAMAMHPGTVLHARRHPAARTPRRRRCRSTARRPGRGTTARCGRRRRSFAPRAAGLRCGHWRRRGSRPGRRRSRPTAACRRTAWVPATAASCGWCWDRDCARC